MEELETLIVQANDTNDKLDELITVNESSLVQQKEIAESISELNPTMEAILVKLAEEKDQEKVTVSKMDSLPEELNSVVGGFSTVFIKGEKGDSPSEEELNKLIKPLLPTNEDLEKLIEPLIPEPIKGDDGEDYILTNEDKEEIASMIEVPIVEKVIEKTIIEQPIDKTVTIDKTKTIVKEVAKYETGEEIVQKINKLPKSIDWKTIKNAPEIKNNGGNGIGYINEASDVSVSNLQNNQTLKWNSQKNAWENGDAVGGSVYTHTQTTALDVWLINHNLNNTAPVITVWDSYGLAVEPEIIEVIDENTIQITFGEAISGKATVVSSGVFVESTGGECCVETVNNVEPDENKNIQLTTSDIAEGTNEYYTDAKADARINAQKGVNNGIASLGSDGKIPQSQVPAIAFTDVFVVADQTARLALSATVGDVAIQLDNNKSYILAGSDPSDNADWEEIVTGTNVTSVNGETGTVTLDTDDIDEGSTNKYFTGVTKDGTLGGDGQTTPLTVNAVNDSKYVVSAFVATTATLANTPTYNNGTSGVGATLTRTGNGAFPAQDGVAVPVGSKVLVKNQTTTLQNGVYVLTDAGSVSTPWVLTRDVSSDTASKLSGQQVTVQLGTTNAGNTYRQATTNPTVGTSNIAYAETSGTVIRQAATGSQAVNQIPLYTSTVRQLTRGSSDFTYNPSSGVFRVRGLDYTYPTSHSAGFLKNNGTGTITFDAIAKSDVTGLQTDLDDLQDQIDTKQDILVDGSNIKTVNGLPLMGSGNINIPGELLVTFGTPTQSAFATGSVTVASNDYDEVKETEVTLGALGTGGIKYKYYDSRVDSAPSSPTVGVNISSLYLNGKIDSSVENVNIIEYSDKSDDFDTNFDENLGYRYTTNVLTYYGESTIRQTVIVQVDLSDIGTFALPIIKIGDNYGLFYGLIGQGIYDINNLYKLTLTSTTGTYDDTAYSVDEDTYIWSGIPSGLVGSDLYVYNASDTPTVGQIINVTDDTGTPIFSAEITAVSEITGNLYQMQRIVSPNLSGNYGFIATEDFYSSLVFETGYPIYKREAFSSCNYDEIDTDTAIISKLGTNTFDFAANDLVVRLKSNSEAYNPQGMLIDSLTSTGFIQDGGTVTLGSKTYTFQNTLTNVDGNVKIGATDNDTLQNLTDAIKLTGTAGTQYATAMTIHPTLTASRTSGTIVLTAKVFGTGGNGISCTTTVNGIVFRATGTNNIATVTAGGATPTTTTLATSLNTAINANTKPSINGLRISNSTSGANVNISCTVPGTLGNSFALATTNPTGISVSGATLTGGNTSGTLGVAGEIRLGYIVGSSVEQTFLCIQNSVWKNLSNFTTPYTWTAA